MTTPPFKDLLTTDMIANLWPVITSTSKPGIEMPNPWILPSSAPEEWFKDLPVGNVSVLAGEDEILRDDIVAIGGFLQVSISSPSLYK
jgi:hypothetical protein